LQAGGKSRHAPVASVPRQGTRSGTSLRAHAPKAAPAFRSGTRNR
jgi:hypothetical protein